MGPVCYSTIWAIVWLCSPTTGSVLDEKGIHDADVFVFPSGSFPDSLRCNLNFERSLDKQPKLLLSKRESNSIAEEEDGLDISENSILVNDPKLEVSAASTKKARSSNESTYFVEASNIDSDNASSLSSKLSKLFDFLPLIPFMKPENSLTSMSDENTPLIVREINKKGITNERSIEMSTTTPKLNRVSLSKANFGPPIIGQFVNDNLPLENLTMGGLPDVLNAFNQSSNLTEIKLIIEKSKISTQFLKDRNSKSNQLRKTSFSKNKTVAIFGFDFSTDDPKIPFLVNLSNPLEGNLNPTSKNDLKNEKLKEKVFGVLRNVTNGSATTSEVVHAKKETPGAGVSVAAIKKTETQMPNLMLEMVSVDFLSNPTTKKVETEPNDITGAYKAELKIANVVKPSLKDQSSAKNSAKSVSSLLSEKGEENIAKVNPMLMTTNSPYGTEAEVLLKFNKLFEKEPKNASANIYKTSAPDIFQLSKLMTKKWVNQLKGKKTTDLPLEAISDKYFYISLASNNMTSDYNEITSTKQHLETSKNLVKEFTMTTSKNPRSLVNNQTGSFPEETDATTETVEGGQSEGSTEGTATSCDPGASTKTTMSGKCETSTSSCKQASTGATVKSKCTETTATITTSCDSSSAKTTTDGSKGSTCAKDIKKNVSPNMAVIISKGLTTESKIIKVNNQNLTKGVSDNEEDFSASSLKPSEDNSLISSLKSMMVFGNGKQPAFPENIKKVKEISSSTSHTKRDVPPLDAGFTQALKNTENKQLEAKLESGVAKKQTSATLLHQAIEADKDIKDALLKTKNISSRKDIPIQYDKINEDGKLAIQMDHDTKPTPAVNNAENLEFLPKSTFKEEVHHLKKNFQKDLKNFHTTSSYLIKKINEEEELALNEAREFENDFMQKFKQSEFMLNNKWGINSSESSIKNVVKEKALLGDSVSDEESRLTRNLILLASTCFILFILAFALARSKGVKSGYRLVVSRYWNRDYDSVHIDSSGVKPLLGERRALSEARINRDIQNLQNPLIQPLHNEQDEVVGVSLAK